MAQWYAQVGGQRYGPVSDEEIRTWFSQGRVKPTDYVWSEGMAAWSQAGAAFGQAGFVNVDPPIISSPAGSSNPADSANPLLPQTPYPPVPVNPFPRQPVYRASAVLANVPGAVPSMVWGITGAVLSLPCLGFLSFITVPAGMAFGIIALVQAKKAKVLLAAFPDIYGGQGVIMAGFVLGIVAIALACLCLIGWLEFFGLRTMLDSTFKTW